MARFSWITRRCLSVAVCLTSACFHSSRPAPDHPDSAVDTRPAPPPGSYSLEDLAAFAAPASPREWGVRFRLTDAQGRADVEARPARFGYAGSPLHPIQAPRMVVSPAPYETVPRVPCLLLRFDRTVDRELLQRDARFEVNGQQVRALPISLAKAARLPPCDSVLSGAATQWSQAFVPERMLPPDSEVVFRSGRVQGVGDEHSAPEITHRMRTYGPFVLLPEGSTNPTNIGMDFSVRLSSPLRGGLSPERITLSPPAHIAEVDVVGEHVSLRVFGEPNRSYTLTLPADLEDVSGQRIAADARTAVIPATSAATLLHGPTNNVVLAPGEALPVDSFGVQTLSVRIQPVGLEDVTRYLGPGGVRADAALFTEAAISRDIEVEDPWNYTRTPLTLEQLGVQRPGHYVVEIRGRSKTTEPRPLLSWVQRTSLHFAARFRARHVFAHLTDAASREPVKGASIGFLGGPSAQTDADGWVKLPLPLEPPKAGEVLVARSGDETVLMHSDSLYRDRSSLRAPGAVPPSVVAYSDRGTYFPGEQVVFHGYVRRYANHAPGLESRGFPKRLHFQLRSQSHDERVLAEADAALSAHGEFAVRFQLPSDPDLGPYGIGASLAVRGASYDFQRAQSIRIVSLPMSWETSLWLSQRSLRKEESLSVRVDAHDAEGRPRTGLPVNAVVEVISRAFEVPGFEDFLAGGYDRHPFAFTPSAADGLRHHAQLQTDASGQVTLQITPEQLQHPVRYQASVKTVTRDGQAQHAQRKDFTVDPADHYAAVRLHIHHDRGTEPVLYVGRAWSVDLLGVDRAGRVTAGVPMTLRVINLDPVNKEVASCKVVSTLAPARCELPPLTHEGSYAIVAEAVDPEGRRSISRQVMHVGADPRSAVAPVPAHLIGPDAWEQHAELVQRELSVTLAHHIEADRRVRVVARVTDARGQPVSGARLAWMSVDEEAVEHGTYAVSPVDAFRGPLGGEIPIAAAPYRPQPLPKWHQPFRCGNEIQPVENHLRKRARPLLHTDFQSRTDAHGEASVRFELPPDAGAVVRVTASRNAAEFGRAALRVPSDGMSCKAGLPSCP